MPSDNCRRKTALHTARSPLIHQPSQCTSPNEGTPWPTCVHADPTSTKRPGPTARDVLPRALLKMHNLKQNAAEIHAKMPKRRQEDLPHHVGGCGGRTGPAAIGSTTGASDRRGMANLGSPIRKRLSRLESTSATRSDSSSWTACPA
jgi:hypothetical protein